MRLEANPEPGRATLPDKREFWGNQDYNETEPPQPVKVGKKQDTYFRRGIVSVSLSQGQVEGTVWGMDFTKPPRPIDGLYPYILNVRDLGSGQQLAWRPVADEKAQTVLAELTVLFTILGAPLILKSDNGSAFRAMLTKNF